MELSTGTLRMAQALQAVEQGQSQAQFSRTYQIPKNTVSRLFKRLEAENLIHAKAISRPIIYELTTKGQDFLKLFKRSVSNGTFKPMFRYEHLFFTSEIRSMPPDMEKRLKRGGFVPSSRRHYRGWQVKGEEATIFISGKTVWFLPKPVWSDSVANALSKALKIVLDLKIDLEQRFGFRLGYPKRVFELRRQEVAMLKGVCDFFPKGAYFKGERVKVDCSHKEPELETFHKGFALDDMGRIVGFLDSVAKEEVSKEELLAVREFLPSLKEFVALMKKPKLEPDYRDRW